jgi:hypothetical protein
MIGGLLTDFKPEDVYGVIFLAGTVGCLLLVFWLVWKEFRR